MSERPEHGRCGVREGPCARANPRPREGGVVAWVKLDDKFHSHRKVRRAGLAAVGLHCRAMSYTADERLDGHVDLPWVREVGGSQATRLAQALGDAGPGGANGDGG